MGEALIVRRDSINSLGETLFAVINATYSFGSFCTCTNGTKTLSAEDTNGQWAFIIPEAGTWTVTCTDGTNTNSKSVNITSEGQIENVTLSSNKYTYFYNRGIQNVPWSWKGTLGSSGSSEENTQKWAMVSFGADNMRLYMTTEFGTTEAGVARAYTTNPIDVTDINTLYIVTSGGTGDSTYIDRFGIGDPISVLDYGEAGTIISKSDSEITTSLDVSSLTGTHQIYVEHWNRLAFLPDLYVYEVYGE